jgi:hypothetical protein
VEAVEVPVRVAAPDGGHQDGGRQPDLSAASAR